MKFIFLTFILPVCLLFFTADPGKPDKAAGSFSALPPGVSIVAGNLDIPWEITWGPDNKIWITEQKGLVSRIDPETGAKDTLLQISDVWHYRTAGLLGMALHSDMKRHPYVFLNYLYLKDKKPLSRLVRYTWKGDTLADPEILMEIPGNNGHSGSRLAFSGGKLFWATGDAISDVNSQDINSPNGKILRLNTDGSVPADNPVKGSPVWAMGFRNIQGMTFSASGKLYISEHGDATDDEVGLIIPGGNYGWPRVTGFAESAEQAAFKREKGTLDPLKAWTPTIGPAGIDHYSSDKFTQLKNSLLLVTLKGKSLRILKLNPEGTAIESEEILFENQYGRLRDLCISPAGDVYISTSNRDWNPSPGFPLEGDDKILKLSLSGSAGDLIAGVRQAAADKNDGTGLYSLYCASCHKDNALGVEGVFPPLKNSDLVKGDELPLINKVLKGSSGKVQIRGVVYDTSMPSFSFLKDEELAGILTYIRSLQPGKLSEISASAIAEARRN